jgi:hypothetical protein
MVEKEVNSAEKLLASFHRNLPILFGKLPAPAKRD